MSSLSLGEISKKIDATLIGDKNLLVKGIKESRSCKKEYICFVKDKNFLSSLSRSSGAVILEESLARSIDFDTNLLIHNNPYLAYANLTEIFVKKYDDHNEGIESKIGQNVNVGKHSSIGKNCIISDNVTIKDNVSIYPGTHIGSNVVIHSGSVLGSDGFGFVPTDNGWQKIFHLGGLVIEDNCEIGANCTIDRGALGNTVLHQNVKLDNAVHLAHNVTIGKNTAIAAQTAIAGSVSVGNDCRISGHVGILDHLEIGNNVTLLAKSLVTTSILKPGTYSSFYPTQEHKKALKLFAKIKNEK